MRSRKPKAPTACRVCIHQRSYTSIHIVHIYTNMRRLYYCAHTLTAAAAACRHDNMTPTAVIYQKHKGQSQYQYHAASCIYWYWYWRTRYQGTGEVPCYYQTRKQTDYAACALYMQTAVRGTSIYLLPCRIPAQAKERYQVFTTGRINRRTPAHSPRPRADELQRCSSRQRSGGIT